MICKGLIPFMFRLTLLAGVIPGLAAPLQAQGPATNSVIAIGPSSQGIVQAGDGNFYAPSLKFFESCDTDDTMLCANIYKITPDGTMSVFHAFQPEADSDGVGSPNTDGIWPTALIVGSDGNLYGACQYGGPGGFGTIFRITLSGTFTLLKSFGLNSGTINGIDLGYSPLSLIQGSDGSLYTTNGAGVYQLTPDGSFDTLFTFQIDPATQLFPQGGNATSLMQGDDGNLYLTLSTGPQPAQGTGANGSIARLSLVNYLLTTVHAFLDNGTEGSNPTGPLVEGRDGDLYGATLRNTTIPSYAFKVSSLGILDLLHTFTGSADGALPQTPFFLGSDGNFYGSTRVGGDTGSPNCQPAGCGTVYQLTPGGSLTTLHDFEGGTPTSTVVSQNPQVDGAVPEAPLVQANDGSFYGTTLYNVIFKTVLNSAPAAPVQLTLDPTTVIAGNPVTVTWKVLNAFSQTAQVCGAYVVGNSLGAGTWSGPLKGTLSAGVYSGTATITPTAGGTYTYAVSCGGDESAMITLVVSSNLPLQISPPGPSKGTVSQPFQLVLSATGGVTPYLWSIAGNTPKGLIFSSAGTLMGTPLQYGDYQLAFGVQDSTTPPPAEKDAVAFALSIASGLNLLGVLPNAVVGKPYQQTLVTSGGLPPYTWALASGALPDGLKLNTASSAITGTPIKAGSFTFSVTVSDSEGTKAEFTTNFTLVTAVPPLEITSSGLLPDASVGVQYSFGMAATGGTPPYFWTILPSAPPTLIDPPGLTISQDGILSGTPIQNAPFYDDFSIQVTDSEKPPVRTKQSMALKVKKTLQITTTSLPVGTVGVPMNVPLTATGGIPPYKWKAASNPDPNTIGLYVDGDNLAYDPIVATTASVILYLSDSEASPDSTDITLPLTFLPTPLVTTTALTSSNTAAGTGETVTFTAKVTIAGGGAPPGQVIFYNGTTNLGTSILDANGNATLQTSFAADGVYSIKAAYGGNTSFAASTSTALTETVVTPGITAVVSPLSLTVEPGSSGQLVITVTPTGGYTGKLEFSCGTLPAHVSCAFAPPSLTIDASAGPFTDTLTVSTDAPLTAMLLEPRNGGARNSVFAAVSLWLPGLFAAVCGLASRKGRRTARGLRSFWVIAILCLAGAAALTGCAGSSNTAGAGTYKIPVTVSVAGGAKVNISATVIVD